MSEAELVARARDGDQDAFGELVSRYQGAVYRAAIAALRSRDEADDVAQEAFLVAFRKIGGFRGEASFKTWLLTITWRKALDRRRSIREWASRLVTPAESDNRPLDPPSPERSHEDQVIDADLRAHVRRAIHSLPARFRDVLLLAAAGDHTFEEMAAILGVPVGTAKWRASEGRRMLKHKLASLGYRDG